MHNQRSLRTRLTLLISALFLLMCTMQMLLNSYHTSQQVNALIQTIPLAENEINRVDMELVTIGQADAVISDVFLQNSLTLLIVLILGAVCTYGLVGYCLKPLYQLNDHIRHTTMNNLYMQPKIQGGTDEIEHLADSFHDLSQRLADTFANQQRFLADAAHELRTPLAVLQTKLDVFARRSHELSEYEELLETVRRQTCRLTHLSNQLLDLTRQSVPVIDLFSLRMLTEEICCDLQELANQQHVSLNLQIADDLMVETDMSALYRILFNLIENGIKYNQNGGSVTICAQRTERDWRLMVTDTGIGIKEADAAMVFEPFWRAENSRSRTLGGAGLGLSMVKKLTEQLHGSIEIQQNHPCGTVFTLIFKNR